MSLFAVGALVVTMLGFGVLHYLISHRFWLSLVQRAFCWFAYWVLMGVIAVGIDVMVFEGKEALMLGLGAILFSLFVSYSLYFYHKNTLKTARKFKARIEKAQAQGQQDIVDFNVLCLAKLLLPLGKLKELEELGLVEQNPD